MSTLDQNTARQLDGIAVDRTFTDKASGKDTRRPQLAAMLGFVRDGDTVIAHSMDRLARNLEDLRRIVRELTAKGVQVQFVKEQLTFTGEDTAMANLLLSVMGAFAEFERALTGERQREGITLAMARGAYRGRKKSLSEEQSQQLRQRAGVGVPAFRPLHRRRWRRSAGGVGVVSVECPDGGGRPGRPTTGSSVPGSRSGPLIRPPHTPPPPPRPRRTSTRPSMRNCA